MMGMEYDVGFGIMGFWHIIIAGLALLPLILVAISDRVDGVSKIIWLLIVFWLPLLGLILFFIFTSPPNNDE